MSGWSAFGAFFDKRAGVRRHFARLRNAVFVVLVATPFAHAQMAERQIQPVPDTDFFGHDYDILKDVDSNICETACLSDNRCRAFTLNVNSGWCFLKEAVGEQRQTAGAFSGRIVDVGAADETLIVERERELGFLPSGLVDEARRLRLRIKDEPRGGDSDASALAEADAALARGNYGDAIAGFRDYLRRQPQDAAAWRGLANAALLFTSGDWQQNQEMQGLRKPAAVSAYVTAASDSDKAQALDLLAQALGEEGDWKAAIRVWRAAVALNDDATIAGRLERAVAEHGFRIVDNSVDNNASSPRICLNFSEDLSPALASGNSAGDFISVEGGDALPVSVSGAQMCVEGVSHGQRYRIIARSGIRSASGEVLPRTVESIIYVRDRDPAAYFSGNAYVLPAGGDVSLPVTSVNTDQLKLRLLRIGDRQLARTIGESRFLQQLSSYELDEIAQNSGEEVWQGTIDVAGATNAEIVTGVPMREMLHKAAAGVYILSAMPANAPPNSGASLAQQWFVLTDIGLTSFAGADGFHVAARSLGSAEPLQGIELELIAANNIVLGTAETGEDGHAVFAPGLLAGEGGDRPAVLAASTADGDFVFLDMTAAPFDLSDRGVAGRDPAGPLDIFMTPERGIYRPGDRVNLTLLVRDPGAKAVDDARLTLIVTRPDGVEFLRQVVTPGAAGGAAEAVDLPAGAMRGEWRFAMHIDPKRPALASMSVQVQDFEPQKIAFELQPVAELDPANPPELHSTVRYLFGAPAANLNAEGEVVLRPVAGLPAFPGYVFGLADDEMTAQRLPFDGAVTDAGGAVTLSLSPFEPPATTRPVAAELVMRVTDAGGRPVEERMETVLKSTDARLGIKPEFTGAVSENGIARFAAVALGADGSQSDAGDASWVLNRVRTDFQWYSSGGRWNYETVRRRERVADGNLAIGAGSPAQISAPVEWGEYELVVSAPGMLPASTVFNAGWYSAGSGVDTPEMARVSLDKQRYQPGDEAVVHIEPRFAGKAEILVLGEGLIDQVTADLPAEGGEVRLPVTQAWGTGAYIAAVIYRPMDIDARRMPGRAIGLAHAAIEPAERALQVALAAPENLRPQQTVSVDISVANVTGPAFVTLAAVDSGILNITDFQPPAPGDYYFGQRRLGVDIRDLYSRLIDRMQGAPGSVRSGGDASADMISPPPMEDLVSLFSGVVQLDENGKGTVDFDIPDFNGTLRLMAVAWSETGVGQAHADMVVRAPVVTEIIRPHFLSPGDVSRIAVDVTHADGPTGATKLSVSGGEGVIAIQGERAATLELAEGERKRLMLPVRAEAVGAAELTVQVTTPGGETFSRQLTLPVQNLQPPVVQHSSFTLAAGRALTLDDSLFADFAPGSGSATLSVTALGGFDVAGAVRALDLYPYGCTEQLTSRALPMVYLDDTILAAGLGGSVDVRKRVQEAIDGILANQSSSGSFGLWNPDYGDLWLDSYVTDFLNRAAEKGYAVPRQALAMALDNLANQVAYLPEEPDWTPAAYAYYVLARAGRASIGDLRYVADNRTDEFATPLARAQLAAALAIYGDRVRAETVFRTALADALAGTQDKRGRMDYGTALRDDAAVLTLGLEGNIQGVDLAPLVQKVSQSRSARTHTSTQEDAWSLLAAHALVTSRAPKLELDGEIREGAYATRFDRATLASAARIRNAGDGDLTADVTVRGIPATSMPSDAAGYEIRRSYYTLDGASADLTQIAQGDRLVAVLDVLPVDDNAARLVVDDPLPAGFEIDNPAILRGGDVAALSFLELTDSVAHTEFRAERFIAAVDKAEGNVEPLRFAYVVRAVSPGTFQHPAAIVENMYRPERRGRTQDGQIAIAGPLQ